MDRLNGIAKNKLPSLLRGIDGILNKSTLERKKEVRDIVAATLVMEFTGITIKFTARFAAHFTEQVLNVVKDKETDWVSKALQCAADWGTDCKTATFMAFCRRSGCWKLPRSREKTVSRRYM